MFTHVFISLYIILLIRAFGAITIKSSDLESRKNIYSSYLNCNFPQKLPQIYSKIPSEPIGSDDFHKKLHIEALKAPEFRLHTPPTTDDKLVKIPELIDHNNENLQAKETDILKLVDNGVIPDFRYPKYTKADSNLLSWHHDRPPDVYVIKFEGVLYLYPKESALIGYNAALKLLDPQQDFTLDIPIYFYHLLLNSLPLLISKADYVLAGLKYITTLHKDINYDSLTESIENLIRTNDSSDPFQPFSAYTGSNKRSKPFMVGINIDVLGIKAFVSKHISLFKNLSADEFGYSNSDLNEAYNSQQELLESNASWEEVFLYRNSIPVSDKFADRFHQLSFNHAATQAVLHHAKVWRMPVYIASRFYSADELRRRVSTILSSVSHGNFGDALDYISFHTDPSTTWLSDIVSKVRIDELPVHVFSDRLDDLSIPDSNNLRLHFVDWGHSLYSEKLRALYSPDVRYLNHTKQLVSLMGLPSTNTGRCWDSGYQLLPPVAELGKFLESWKRKWEKPEDPPQTKIPIAIN